MGKKLVAFFSASGVTAKAAETTVVEGELLNGRQTEKSLRAWAEQLGL